eukprot:4031378-Prymnesium_polylepis.1
MKQGEIFHCTCIQVYRVVDVYTNAPSGERTCPPPRARRTPTRPRVHSATGARELRTSIAPAAGLQKRTHRLDKVLCAPQLRRRPRTADFPPPSSPAEATYHEPNVYVRAELRLVMERAEDRAGGQTGASGRRDCVRPEPIPGSQRCGQTPRVP